MKDMRFSLISHKSMTATVVKIEIPDSISVDVKAHQVWRVTQEVRATSKHNTCLADIAASEFECDAFVLLAHGDHNGFSEPMHFTGIQTSAGIQPKPDSQATNQQTHEWDHGPESFEQAHIQLLDQPAHLLEQALD